MPSLGTCPRGRWDLGVPWGVGGSEIQPDLACELLTSMAHATDNFFGPHPLGPWGGAKRSNIKKSQSQKAISKIFKPNFVCLLTNDRYTTYQRGFSLHRLGHAPGVGLRGTVGGGWGVKKLFFLPKPTRFGV